MEVQSSRILSKTGSSQAAVAETDQQINHVRLGEDLLVDAGAKSHAHVLKKAKWFAANIRLKGFKTVVDGLVANQAVVYAPDQVTHSKPRSNEG